MSISKQGLITLNNFNTVIELDGCTWVPIVCQDAKLGNNMFSTSDDFSTYVYHNDSCWCNFGLIKTETRPNDNYEFLVLQQNDITTDSATFTKYHWAQTKSPFEATRDEVHNSSGNITHYDGTTYGGAYVMNGAVYMCFDDGSTSDWFGTAHTKLWGGTAGTNGYLPGYNNGKVYRYQLFYMRVKDNKYKEHATQDIATDIYEI